MGRGPLPCHSCGGVKMPGQGQRYCAECHDRLKPMFEQARYLARQERAREARRKAGTDRKLVAQAPAGTKWCARCLQYLPVDEFGTRGAKLAAYCKPCASAYNHERILARDFGITPERYQELLDLQGGRCAICERKSRARRLAVDHDHETGEVRGLLCTRCNHKLLGAAHESTAMLRRAARYLDAPPAITGSPVPPDEGDDELILAAALDEANTEAANDSVSLSGGTFAGKSLGLAWIKRKGRTSALDGYVVMDGRTALRLLREAGY